MSKRTAAILIEDIDGALEKITRYVAGMDETGFVASSSHRDFRELEAPTQEKGGWVGLQKDEG